MTLHVWACNLANEKNFGESIFSRLTTNGVEITPVDSIGTEGTGVLVLDEPSADVDSQLQSIYPVSARHLLVIHNGKLPAAYARQLMHAGASDIMTMSDGQDSIDEMLARIQRWDAVEKLLDLPYVKDRLVGESSVWKNTLRQLVEIAHFTEASVLVQGESGTGKELVAGLIHELDDRQRKKELVILDCSTITPDLSGSEFFGHERGAFTGAVSARDGAFALADQGTLFLDEIGELPLHLQTQLLRVIQEQTFKRVGGNTWHRTSFRLVCATNRDLWAQVQKGEFRADLYFRLASFVCQLPPLRERAGDVLHLAKYFLNTHNHAGHYPLVMDTAVEEYLLNRSYPGNIRDLRQVVTRLLCRHAGKGMITLGCIPPDEREHWFQNHSVWHQGNFELAIKRGLMDGAGLKDVSRMAEEIAIRIAVDEAAGNLQQAAQRLGVTDRTLQLR
ncbi:MAG TPA: sigma 54-interacting transcriptional regulator, partial [Cellvibrio sp.]|nr:sigma 54-interacting transcriptional regulator [Cellvibrio sp.]